MQNLIHELDAVALTTDIPQQGLLRGQVGTVVMEHDTDFVEVEFVDEHGVAYALVLLPNNQILRLRYHRVEAA